MEWKVLVLCLVISQAVSTPGFLQSTARTLQQENGQTAAETPKLGPNQFQVTLMPKSALSNPPANVNLAAD